ncbi:class I SAM-dependent methyltransferase [Nesterenkonia ebinurensis]|uniref:class I SAM-dependent methyltransferase n=1 Tax=Nesterenkonia ebinurensis TaxID=2608252 RepID=UPI001CC3ADD5|nr:methyltransferase [Nesterenkonia ebinurensis]
MNSSHYFSSPEGPFKRHRIQVELAGRQAEVVTSAGIFSPDGVDKGTQVLLREVPDPSPSGHLLDIGCGWGPVALTMAMLSPEATVWAVDINERARTLCAENAAALGLENVRVCAPDEMPGGHRFATIWSNPPIRIGKPALHELLELWLPRLEEAPPSEPGSAEALAREAKEAGPRGPVTEQSAVQHPAEGGSAWLVVQKNLGADSLLTWLKSMLAVVGDDFAAERAASSKGFRILRVSRGSII